MGYVLKTGFNMDLFMMGDIRICRFCWDFMGYTATTYKHHNLMLLGFNGTHPGW